MQVVIVGTGNVASVMTKALLTAGHTVLQVAGRNETELRLLCEPLGLSYTSEWTNIDKTAQIYIIAVADQAVASVAAQLKLPGALVVHTAGSVPESVLTIASEHTGVFYPLQSVRKEIDRIPAFSLLIHAAFPNDEKLLQELAASIAEKVMIADDEQRGYYHLAAVIANNFSNHLYCVADKFCHEHGIEFKALLPMLKEQVLRLETMPPSQLQTGPAIRNDEATIQKHLNLLQNSDKEMYEWFTAAIRQKH
jgi:predicted short-subunit dehydrogenase-like oxidoreductase (DUF2520 family)